MRIHGRTKRRIIYPSGTPNSGLLFIFLAIANMFAGLSMVARPFAGTGTAHRPESPSVNDSKELF